jgi:hypothetical protein
MDDSHRIALMQQVVSEHECLTGFRYNHMRCFLSGTFDGIHDGLAITEFRLLVEIHNHCVDGSDMGEAGPVKTSVR